MADGKAPVEERVDTGIYADFDSFLKQGIKEYYDRGWTTRRGNFIALLIASGQTAFALAKDSVVDGSGTKRVAIGAAAVLALRIGLRYAVGGPLGLVLTVAAGASMVAYFIRNQKDILKKVQRYKLMIAELEKKYTRDPERLARRQVRHPRPQPHDRRPDEALHRGRRRALSRGCERSPLRSARRSSSRPAPAPPPPRRAAKVPLAERPAQADLIGLLDVRVEGVSDAAAEVFAKQIEESLGIAGLQVAPRARLREFLAGTPWNAACLIGECLRDLKVHAGVGTVVEAALVSIGPSYHYVITLLDTETGTIQHQLARKCDVCTTDEAFTNAALDVVELIQQRDGSAAAAAEPSSPPAGAARAQRRAQGRHLPHRGRRGGRGRRVLPALA